MPVRIGAQRLSASWIATFAATPVLGNVVPNARRRHGSFHTPCSTLCGGPCVLNACRRHGSFHVMPTPHTHKALVLTPVGVMDRFTPAASHPDVA